MGDEAVLSHKWVAHVELRVMQKLCCISSAVLAEANWFHIRQTICGQHWIYGRIVDECQQSLHACWKAPAVFSLLVTN